MNNAINEIKNMLKGTKRRITEAEDRISEVEDRIPGMGETGGLLSMGSHRVRLD